MLTAIEQSCSMCTSVVKDFDQLCGWCVYKGTEKTPEWWGKSWRINPNSEAYIYHVYVYDILFIILNRPLNNTLSSNISYKRDGVDGFG